MANLRNPWSNFNFGNQQRPTGFGQQSNGPNIPTPNIPPQGNPLLEKATNAFPNLMPPQNSGGGQSNPITENPTTGPGWSFNKDPNWEQEYLANRERQKNDPNFWAQQDALGRFVPSNAQQYQWWMQNNPEAANAYRQAYMQKLGIDPFAHFQPGYNPGSGPFGQGGTLG